MKRLLCIILTTIIICLSVVTAFADVEFDYGDFTLKLDSESNTFSVSEYSGTDTVVTVPDEYGGYRITSIGSFAFANSSVESITLGENITKIESNAFLNCTSLSQVNLPSSLMYIGESSFSGTTSLFSLNLSETSIISVEEKAFLNSSVEEISLPYTCQSIDSDAFAQCRELLSITIPEMVTSIVNNAFRDSNNVTVSAYNGSYALEFAQNAGLDTETLYRKLGDANCDGKVTLRDVTTIQMYRAEMIEDPYGLIEKCGNVVGSQSLNIRSATIIQMYLAGMNVSYSVGSNI
jgi:hypothetical protein